jgi:hypothetical protein
MPNKPPIPAVSFGGVALGAGVGIVVAAAVAPEAVRLRHGRR